MRRAVAAALSSLTLAVPVADAAAATHAPHRKPAPKKKLVRVTKRIAGTEAQADRWGLLRVVLVVRKTTTIVGKKKKISRRITNVAVPEYPDHTGRSIFINEQALPILRQEVLQAQMNPNIDFVSGATYTSDAFTQSLQAAILKARTA